MNIRKIKNIGHILESNATAYFFDIEETILARNIFYDAMIDRKYAFTFLDLCKANFDISGVIFLGKNYFRNLTDENIPSILKQIREKKASVFALTSGFPSKFKEGKLMKLGVSFDDIIYTKGEKKGAFFSKFLLEKKLEKEHCCFIDNHLDKVENVGESFLKDFPSSKIDLFLYDKKDEQEVDLTKFKTYWEKIVKMYMNNNALNNR